MQDSLNEITDPNGCPQCGSSAVKPVKYTWWGGLLGPKILNHTKCEDCKFLYNRKTGKSNTTPIIIYFVVTFAIMFIVFYMLRS